MREAGSQGRKEFQGESVSLSHDPRTLIELERSDVIFSCTTCPLPVISVLDNWEGNQT